MYLNQIAISVEEINSAVSVVADDEDPVDLANPSYRGKDYRPEFALVDSQVDDKGNHWQGPNRPMPQGFTIDLGRFMSLDHVDLRNGFTKIKEAAVEDFEILLGSTINGPWKRAINGTLVDSEAEIAR